MSGKIDYDFHQAQFNQLAEQDPSLTIKAYCEQAGLKHGTAKRYLKSPKKTKGKVKVEQVREARSTRTRSPARDWAAYYESFLNDCLDNPALSIATFAELHGLPAPQVRRNFANFRKKGDFKELEDQVEVAVSQFNEDLTRKKARAKSLKKRVKKTEPSKGGMAICDAATATNESDHQMGSGDQVAPVSHKSAPGDGRDEYGRFMPGHQHSTIHGGYARLAQLDPDLVEVASSVDPASLANELVTARSQYLSMVRFVGEQRQILIEQYARGEKKKDFDDNEIPLEKALGDLEFGTAGKIRSLEGSITMMVSTHAKIIKDFTSLRHKEHELPAVSSRAALSITQRLYHEKEDKGWTALQTAREFERHGVPVPKTILIEAEREIVTYEAPVDDTGITDDELDRQTAEYMAKQQKYMEQELPERREKLAEVFDAMAEAEEGGSPDDDQEEAEEGEQSHQHPDDEDQVAGAFDDLADFEPIEGDEGANWQES